MNTFWIVVPIYNGIIDIPDFCRTLQEGAQYGTYALVAVDDCSSDNSVELLRTSYPDAVILKNEKNSGFAASCNRGMQYAIDHGAEYVMLANQDLRFMEGWHQPLLSILKGDTSIGAIQPKILMYPDTSLINSCGNELHILGFGYTRGYLQKDVEYSCAAVSDVGYCSGAAVIYRVSVLKRIGLLDECFFMYHEDSDICWRMQIAGYRTVVCPSSVLAHRYEFSRSIQKFYYIERNRLLMMCKNYQFKTLIVLFPLFVLWECGMLAYSIVGLLFRKKSLGIREKLKSYGYFLSPSEWRHIVQTRKSVAALRVKSDADIMRHFTRDIAFQDIDNPVIKLVANPITRAYWTLVRKFL